MSSNQKQSPWYSTPAEKRKRRGTQFTLSDEAREALDEMAGKGNRSLFVEKLLLREYAHHQRKAGAA